MKKSKRLQPVLHLAERNRKLAEQALGEAQQQLVAEEAKKQQLLDYLAEYQNTAKLQQQQGVQAKGLIRLQHFMSRLQQAIDQQTQQVALSQQMLLQARKLWQAAHGRHQAMGSLIDRTVSQELQEDEKRLQKTIDELVQNRR